MFENFKATTFKITNAFSQWVQNQKESEPNIAPRYHWRKTEKAAKEFFYPASEIELREREKREKDLDERIFKR